MRHSLTILVAMLSMAAGAWHGGAIAETQQHATADARLQMSDPVIELDCVALVHDDRAAAPEAARRDDVVDRVVATSRHLVAAPCR